MLRTSAPRKRVDGVVGDDALGDEVVRPLDVEVVDRAVELDALDALDDVERAVLVDHDHADLHVAAVVNGTELPWPATAREPRRDDRASSARRCARPSISRAGVLEHVSYAPARSGRLAHAQPELLERRPPAASWPKTTDPVHRRRAAPIAAQGEVDVSPPPSTSAGGGAGASRSSPVREQADPPRSLSIDAKIRSISA